jgi:hypothetical protein
MTFRRALQVLIQHAAENQAGTGCGIRSLPSDNARMEIAEAIEKTWPKAYGTFDLDDATRHNLGILRVRERP